MAPQHNPASGTKKRPYLIYVRQDKFFVPHDRLRDVLVQVHKHPLSSLVRAVALDANRTRHTPRAVDTPPFVQLPGAMRTVVALGQVPAGRQEEILQRWKPAGEQGGRPREVKYRCPCCPHELFRVRDGVGRIMVYVGVDDDPQVYELVQGPEAKEDPVLWGSVSLR